MVAARVGAGNALPDLAPDVSSGTRAARPGPGDPAPAPGTEFFAHVSLAYANGPQAAAPVRAALNRAAPVPCEVPRAHLSLLELRRDDRSYEWRTLADLPVGPPVS